MNKGDGEDRHKEDDDFSERFSGWHYQLGWGDGSASVAPYVPTPQSLVNKMLELVEAGLGDVLYDLGCGDGKLTASLHAGDSYLVHGLDTDPKQVAKAREHIRS
ncbi:MAG: class I SAM-dependent methyltransferase, partial [Candidatus Bathyarchaeota archaeon]